MAYIYGIILIGLFFAALHYFTDLTHSQKWWVITTVLAIISIAIMFNTYNEQKNEKTRDIVVKFKQGKTINCNEIKVNTQAYTLSVGTYTFIGKENTSNAGQMISLSDCE
ncbi:MAG: hypothetical protein JKY28_05970 [Sulfurimonas sp.]|nr:hypothetical protein [Sulfurimonas sp.]